VCGEEFWTAKWNNVYGEGWIFINFDVFLDSMCLMLMFS